jgi:hypothetical protein
VEHGSRVSDKTVRATAESAIFKKSTGYVRDVLTHDKPLVGSIRTVGYVATCV